MRSATQKAVLLIAVLASYALLSLATAEPIQDYAPTTPGLTSAEASIDLSVPDAMKRAADALRAAGMVPHNPMPHTIGGNNEWVFALIDCTTLAGKTRVTVAVASNPTKRGESHRQCMFLIEYMRTGKVPANSGLTGSVIGVWEWDWQGYAGSGKSKVTLQPDGKATCPDPGWATGEWWIEPDGTVRVYWPTSFPKTNLHYVMVFTLSPDGRTMSTSAGNYYYKSVKATRVGEAPAVAAPAGTLSDQARGVWEWKWQGYSGSGVSRITLGGDGKATASDAGAVPGEWWVQDGKVMVFWNSSAPKTNLHYVTVFTMAPDGRSMATSNGNYYYQSVSATKVGDAPSAAQPPNTGGTAAGTSGGSAGGNPPAGAKPPEPAPGETVTTIEPPKLSPPPLKLPPVGAQSGLKTELFRVIFGEHLPTPKPRPTTQDPAIVSLKATPIENQYIPEGLIQVDVELSAPAPNFTVDLYVGGCIRAVQGGIDGVKNAGLQAAYEWAPLNENFNKHPDRRGKVWRALFKVPRVLPADIRAELYETPLGKPRRFVGEKKTSITMPWKDYAVVSGWIFGDKPKSVITKVSVLVTTGTESWAAWYPGEIPSELNQNDFFITCRFKPGEDIFSSTQIRNIGRRIRWRELRIDVGPTQKDIDHRNNTYWPELPNRGWLEAEPIWAEGAYRA